MDYNRVLSIQAGPNRDRVTNVTFYGLFHRKNLAACVRILPSLGQDKDEKIKIKMKHQVITSHFPRNRGAVSSAA